MFRFVTSFTSVLELLYGPRRKPAPDLFRTCFRPGLERLEIRNLCASIADIGQPFIGPIAPSSPVAESGEPSTELVAIDTPLLNGIDVQPIVLSGAGQALFVGPLAPQSAPSEGQISVNATSLAVAASLVSKSVSDHRVFAPGAQFTQSFTFKNAGTSTWTNYNLALVSGSDALGALLSVPIPTTAPGATVTVKVPLRAVKTSTGSSGAAQLAYFEIRNGISVVPISGTAFNNPVAKNKVWTSITIDAAPIGPSLPHLSTIGYVDSMNPYVKIGNGGQCTGYAWGRAFEVLGVKISVTQGAGQPWIDALKSTYKVNMTPSEKSIAVWRNSSGGGHVAWVEGVVPGDNPTVVITEANFSSYGKYADLNDPQNTTTSTSPWWGGGFDGAAKTLSASAMKTRGSLTLLGYIHLV